MHGMGDFGNLAPKSPPFRYICTSMILYVSSGKEWKSGTSWLLMRQQSHGHGAFAQAHRSNCQCLCAQCGAVLRPHETLRLRHARSVQRLLHDHGRAAWPALQLKSRVKNRVRVRIEVMITASFVTQLGLRSCRYFTAAWLCMGQWLC